MSVVERVRACAFCGNPIGPERRADATFCTNAHRQAHWRRTQRDAEPLAELLTPAALRQWWLAHPSLPELRAQTAAIEYLRKWRA